MIELPNFENSFQYENDFFLSCNPARIGKLLAHYELYKKILELPGSIVECGVFKGASFSRFAIFRELFENTYSRKIIGFDIFGKFPETNFEADKKTRSKFIESAGEDSISREQLLKVLENKGIQKNVELVSGDIVKTVPLFVQEHPELKISLLNLDTDIYEPAVTILENLWPKIIVGGILILDDYGVFPGETKAVDDFFGDHHVDILKLPFCMTPSYIIKK
ncbi:MAG: TylF/MycF/NovP-related O-methyltransferase [Cyanobacteria bacterium P01_D01_bin.156]